MRDSATRASLRTREGACAPQNAPLSHCFLTPKGGRNRKGSRCQVFAARSSFNKAYNERLTQASPSSQALRSSPSWRRPDFLSKPLAAELALGQETETRRA